jgi:hypothetical protein
MNATLTCLAANCRERLFEIWAEELFEEEKNLVLDRMQLDGSSYVGHASAVLHRDSDRNLLSVW